MGLGFYKAFEELVSSRGVCLCSLVVQAVSALFLDGSSEEGSRGTKPHSSSSSKSSLPVLGLDITPGYPAKL